MYSGISTNIPPIISLHSHCFRVNYKMYCTKRRTLMPQRLIISVVIAYLIPRELIQR